MKYKLTKTSKDTIYGKFYQIEATESFGNVSKGEKGGFIEKEENLSQEGNAWVFGNARVSGNAWVSGDAQVFGDAWVFGDARVSGDAWVFGDARVSGNAWVFGNARVYKQKLIGGYFYYTKKKSEKIETVETYDDGYETLCREPKLDNEPEVVKNPKEIVIDGATYILKN